MKIRLKSYSDRIGSETERYSRHLSYKYEKTLGVRNYFVTCCVLVNKDNKMTNLEWISS